MLKKLMIICIMLRNNRPTAVYCAREEQRRRPTLPRKKCNKRFSFNREKEDKYWMLKAWMMNTK